MIRFTIRDLLWLMLVAALATCWCMERVTVQRQLALWTAKEELLQQRFELADQKGQRFEKLVELHQRMQDVYERMAKSREERDAIEVAQLNQKLDRYEAPSYPLEAEPGIYFLAPVEK